MTMSKIIELRDKRAKAWEAAKAFLDSKRGANDMLTAEDAAAYDKMEAEVVDLGKEIERLERGQAIDRELAMPTSQPLTNSPGKSGKASDECKTAFWNAMRGRKVSGALQIGEDSEGGYLVPDEFERTLIEALEEQNIFR